MKKLYYLAFSLLFFVVVGLSYKYLKPVKSSEIKIADINKNLFALGLVKAQDIFEFKPSLSYQLKDVLVYEGQAVKKGQVLLNLDLGPKVVAPFDGVVTKLNNRVGENVFPQSLVLRMESLDRIYIETPLDALGAAEVKKGMSALALFETFPNQKVTALVDSVYPQEGLFFARLVVESKALPGPVLPGVTVDVVFNLGIKAQALLIPQVSLQQNKVIRLRGSAKDTIDIKTGLAQSDWIEVVQGDLKPGDKVIIK